MNKNIALVGFRCTGKSSIGRGLADKLGLTFVDTDGLIEERAGKIISRIFEEDGEPFFRAIESNVIADVCGQTGLVISAGGGAVMHPPNRDSLRNSSLVVLLTADVATILERMLRDPKTVSTRPPLTQMESMRDEVEHMLTAREDAYQAAAHIRIDTSTDSIRAAVDKIADEYSQRSDD